MQVIYKNEDERGISRETNSVDIVIYVGRNSRYLKRKCIGEFKSRRDRI